jgi:RNA polymerase I-specific transcription initiation factor RRN3
LEDYEGALDDAIFGYTTEDPFNRRIGAEDDSGESDAEAETSLPFDFDDLSSEEGAHSDDDNTLDGHEEHLDTLEKPEAVAQLKDMASKLDAILKIIFAQFESINRGAEPARFFASVPSPSKLSPVGTPMDGEAQRRAVFDALLVVFDHVVLKTFKTRHTQFLLFWYSSLHPDFNDRFTATLIHTALYDGTRPAVHRISASSYLASYISRAKFVSTENTRIAVGLLCEWLENEFRQHAPSPSSSTVSLSEVLVKPTQAKQLAVFYAVFQAAIYIFCYRWKDLCGTDGEESEDEMQTAASRTWIPPLSILKEVVFSHLNPLKVSCHLSFSPSLKSRKVLLCSCGSSIRSHCTPRQLCLLLYSPRAQSSDKAGFFLKRRHSAHASKPLYATFRRHQGRADGRGHLQHVGRGQDRNALSFRPLQAAFDKSLH